MSRNIPGRNDISFPIPSENAHIPITAAYESKNPTLNIKYGLNASRTAAEKANEVYSMLSKHFMCDYDEAGSIGKRYRREDEIGTPYCVTIDFDTLEDNTVTIRDRDTMKQERVNINDLVNIVSEKVKFN